MYNSTILGDVAKVLAVEALPVFIWFYLSKTHLLIKDVLNFYDFNELLNNPVCDLIGSLVFSKWKALSFFVIKIAREPILS